MKLVNFDKYKNIPLTIEKLKDLKFDNNHPNGYNPGFKISGVKINSLASRELGILFVDYGDKWFHTSYVVKIEEYEGYDLVHTLNSIYKVTFETI
jgi:hypothetical protein